VKHFDISYDAFEQLAHPVYGVAMIEYRTVDCDTGAPLAEGYIDR
jgi:cullin-associated NEDD8-dissociated protein 1